jgi:hypothetical protein
VTIERRLRSFDVTAAGGSHSSSPSGEFHGIGWSCSTNSIPSTVSVIGPMNRKRRISPSETTSTPVPSCSAMTWSTARSSSRLKSRAERLPCSKAARASFRYDGRSIDPITSARNTWWPPPVVGPATLTLTKSFATALLNAVEKAYADSW